MGSMITQIRTALQGAGQEGQNLLQVLDQVIAKMQTAGGAGPGTGTGAGYGGSGAPGLPKGSYIGGDGQVYSAPQGTTQPDFTGVGSYKDWMGGTPEEKSGLTWRKQLAIAGYINALSNVVGNWVIPKEDEAARHSFQTLIGGTSNLISSVGAIHSTMNMISSIGGAAGWAAGGLIMGLQLIGWTQFMYQESMYQTQKEIDGRKVSMDYYVKYAWG